MAAPAATKKRKAGAPETDPTLKKPKTAVPAKPKTAPAAKPKPAAKEAVKPSAKASLKSSAKSTVKSSVKPTTTPTPKSTTKPTAQPAAKPARKATTTTALALADADTDLAGFGSASDTDSEHDADQTAHLTGFSDSDTDGDQTDAVPLTALPPLPATATTALATTSKSSKTPTPGVIYLSRIPHGFYESQMRAYFAQFGDVTRLRLARNRRTGASKHHAWLEFAHAEVARIAAETMNNYLLFGHLLKVAVVPAERVHPELFKGSERRFRRVPWNAIERSRVAKTDRAGWGKRVVREERRRSGRVKALKALGYEFEAPALRAVEAVPVQEKKVEETVAEPVKAIEARPADAVTLAQVLGKNKTKQAAKEKVAVPVASAKKAGKKTKTAKA